MVDQVIHVVLGKANPNRMNGVNKVVNSLAISQQALMGKVALWGITKTPQADYPQRSYTTVLFQDVSRWRLDAKFDRELARCSANTVFHLHGGFIPQLFLLSLKLKKYGFRFVFTPHGAYNRVAMQRSAFKKKIYVALLEKPLVRKATRLHFIGRSEIDSATDVFGNVDYCLVPNGQELSTRSARFGQHKLVFAFVGRLDMRTKGLDLLLEGLAKFAAQTTQPLELRVVGDGPDREKLEGLAARFAITHLITFYGACFGQQKQEALDGVDFLCLTSRNEGMPGVVLEAAATGIPVLVSHETNLAEYVSRYFCGVGLAENTAAAIAEGLQAASRAKEMGMQEVWGQNARTMIQREFNWATIGQQLLEAYAA